MPYYSLKNFDDGKSLSEPAIDRNDALRIFGNLLEQRLSLEDNEMAIKTYFMDEWEGEGSHWVNPTIPVYAFPK